MSRFRRFIHNATSGWLLLMAAAIYSLVSFPLANHFLDSSGFGLWTTCMTIAGYLTQFDLGMSSSLGRLLIDHKDARGSGDYGSMIKTATLVFSIQGGIVLLVGAGLSLIMPRLLGLPDSLHQQFTWLALGLTVITTAGFLTRIFSQVLSAHQRTDVGNYAQILSLLAGFTTLWWAFERGWGVYGFLAASAMAWLCTSVLGFAACRQLGLWPSRGEWGSLSREKFRELFAYGMEVFLIGLGTQIFLSSQSVVLTRTMGLEMAGLWSVMTKAFSLVSQLLWRSAGVSMPAFAEMQARGEDQRMWDRYRNLFSLTAALSGFCGVLFAVSNGPFVMVWMRHKYHWPAGNDWLLGFWLVLLTELFCHNSMIMNLKQIRRLKYIYLIEGLAFVTLGLLLTPVGGVSVMLACSILCSACCSFAYGTFRIARHSNVPVSGVILGWNRPLFLMLIATIPPALGLVYLTRTFPPAWQLVFRDLPLSLIGIYILCKKCLPVEFALRFQNYLPKVLRPSCS